MSHTLSQLLPPCVPHVERTEEAADGTGLVESGRVAVTSGYVHSTESMGGSDGPGIRYIIYLQGCPLRCVYCHNPDTRAARAGRLARADELIAQALRYKSYLARGGGVTVSGGEPLLQPGFTYAILSEAKQHGLHTALDTSGYCAFHLAKPALDAADLVLLDLKSGDPAAHRRVTGVDPARIRATAEYLAAAGKPVWVRFVLVPGWTDAPANIKAAARYAASLGNVERVDVLPFHKLGEHKWRRLGLAYELFDTPTPSPAEVDTAVKIFRDEGLTAC